jgi:hypothetical protein
MCNGLMMVEIISFVNPKDNEEGSVVIAVITSHNNSQKQQS